MNAFEHWLIDNPQFHADDDRSDAFAFFAESKGLPEHVTVWDYDSNPDAFAAVDNGSDTPGGGM